MRVQVSTEAGSPIVPSEDHAVVGPTMVAVLDGATVRTDTGCIHSVPWFVKHLASSILDNARLGASGALVAAITSTANRHRETCDLEHPGTPSAAVAIVEVTANEVQYLVLGDVTVVLDSTDGIRAVTDNRVAATAASERAAADALPSGSEAKRTALIVMKHAELAARNVDGGFWIAAADPTAVGQAMTGSLPRMSVRRAALLTDGAARAVAFNLMTWRDLLDAAATKGPAHVIALVRNAEMSDARCERWIRNKPSDDATLVFCDRFEDH